MFSRLTDAFRRNIVNTILKPGESLSCHMVCRSRVNDGYRQYDFDHRGKTLDLNYSRQKNYDSRAKSVNTAEIDSDDKHSWKKNNNTWNVSSWCVLAIGLIAYLLINKAKNGTADAEEKEIEDGSTGQQPGKPVLLTKENYNTVITQLKNDSPFVTSLEIGFELTERELKELYISIQKNTEIGHISWNEGQIAFEILNRIETKLIENNKNYRYHPTDYVHGLLSKHAYVDSKAGDLIALDPNFDSNQLKNWKVVSVHNDTKVSGYYGAIYINDKTHQVVLAVRGTEGGGVDMLKSLVEKNSDWKTNLEEILGGQIVVGRQHVTWRLHQKL